MIGGLIGGALSAVGSIRGGSQAAKANREARNRVNTQRKENEQWYDRRYNEDMTQRADAQRVLTMTEDSIKNRNKQAAGRQAVMGGTAESVAQAKAANNEALSNATSAIAASAGARKDNIEQTYQAKETAYVDQLNAIDRGKADAISRATQGVIGVGGSIANLYD